VGVEPIPATCAILVPAGAGHSGATKRQTGAETTRGAEMGGRAEEKTVVRDKQSWECGTNLRGLGQENVRLALGETGKPFLTFSPQGKKNLYGFAPSGKPPGRGRGGGGGPQRRGRGSGRGPVRAMGKGQQKNQASGSQAGTHNLAGGPDLGFSGALDRPGADGPSAGDPRRRLPGGKGWPAGGGVREGHFKALSRPT